MEPNHFILHESWSYRVIHIEYFVGRHHHERYLDLTLQKEATLEKLRFLRPSQVRINDVAEAPIEIVDIRGRGWEGLNLWITGYAEDVVKIDR